jgi:hypothetical protein
MFRSIPWERIADKLDAMFASFSRPYIAVICGTAVAGACFNASTAPIALPIAGGVVVAYMGARTVDKAIKANADKKKAEIDARQIAPS